MKEFLITESDVSFALNILLAPPMVGSGCSIQERLPYIISQASTGYRVYLQDFAGGKDKLLFHHTSNMLKRLQSSGAPLSLNLIEINSNNIHTINIPTSAITILEINLNNFTIKTLQLLLGKISTLTLQSIRFQE